MRLIGIIFALIVSALCSCSDQADTPSLEVKRDTVLSFGVYGSNAIQLNNFMFGGGSRITISKRDNPFTFYQNEKYDINAYNNLTVELEDGPHPIKAFDIYEIKDFHGTLALAPDVKGIALQKANRSILSVVAWSMTDYEARSGQMGIGDDYGLSLRINVPDELKYTLLVVRRHHNTRIFVMPLFKPTNETAPADFDNTQALLFPWKDCIVPQKDSVMLFPCFGDKSAILCQNMHDGRTKVTVKDAKAQGEDAVFYVCGSFDVKGIPFAYSNRKLKMEEIPNTSGIALCLDNGKILNLLQFPEKAQTVARYHVEYPPRLVGTDEGNVTSFMSSIFIRTKNPYHNWYKVVPVVATHGD